MYGIAFYTQSLFLIFLLTITSLAFYMGFFHAHNSVVSLGKKLCCAVSSVLISGAIWFMLASWTYLGW